MAQSIFRWEDNACLFSTGDRRYHSYLDDIMGSYPSKEESIVKAVILIDKLTSYKIIINQPKSYLACRVMPLSDMW
jgi:hypothetical protein